MSALASALYVGHVRHRRLRPRRHALAYRVFALLVDLDELPELGRRFRFFSHNRFNLFSFFDRDYGAGERGDTRPLRGQVEDMMVEAGIEPDGGAIRLLTMPRILGYAFNPLSIYFCHGRDGAPRAILYEVRNTFGERHSYFLPAEGVAPYRQNCAKQFHVSPFLPMDLSYEFVVTPPAEAYRIAIIERDGAGVMLTATQNMDRAALTDRAMLRAFFTHPLLTLKVIVGIHYEALLLFAKGVRFHRRPPPPLSPATIVPAAPALRKSA
jgi:DUF1365 family protein